MRMMTSALLLGLVLSVSACAAEDDSFDPALDETQLSSESDPAESQGQDGLPDREPPREEERAPAGGCTSAQQQQATTHMNNNHPGAVMVGCSYNPSSGYIVYTYSCANMIGAWYFLCLSGW